MMVTCCCATAALLFLTGCSDDKNNPQTEQVSSGKSARNNFQSSAGSTGPKPHRNNAALGSQDAPALTSSELSTTAASTAQATSKAAEEVSPEPTPIVINTSPDSWREELTAPKEDLKFGRINVNVKTGGAPVEYEICLQRDEPDPKGDPREIKMSQRSFVAGQPFILKLSGVEMAAVQALLRRGEQVIELPAGKVNPAGDYVIEGTFPTTAPGQYDFIAARTHSIATIWKNAVTVAEK